MLNSSLIGKIDKAKRYQQEPERINFQAMTVTINGENATHNVSLTDTNWHCDCDFFGHHNTCSHVMAMQRILAPMLTPDARYGPDPYVNARLHEEEVAAAS
jgi:hypothetical protein